MKKILALALALAMSLSMAVVGLAVNAEDVELLFRTTPFTLDEDRGQHFVDAQNPVFGDSVYDLISIIKKDGTGVDFVVSEDDADTFRLSAKWEEGGEYIEGVKLSKKNLGGGNVYYVVEIATKKAPSEAESKDVIGTVTVKSRKFATAEGEHEVKRDIAFTLENEAGKAGTTTNEPRVYTFGEGEEDFTIEFFADAGRFEVDTRGQGDLVITTDVEYNEGIEEISPDVSYMYFNANNATFNKIGTLYINAHEGDVLYRVNSDGTLKLSNAPYDADEEAFKVRTRVLSSYVVAERELDVESINSSIDKTKKSLGASLLGADDSDAGTAAFVPVNPRTGASL